MRESVESRSSPSATSSFAREQQCSSHASEHQSAMDSVLDATATTTTTAPADGDESIKDGNDDKDNVDSVDDEGESALLLYIVSACQARDQNF